jgi:hypothetical protein
MDACHTKEHLDGTISQQLHHQAWLDDPSPVNRAHYELVCNSSCHRHSVRPGLAQAVLVLLAAALHMKSGMHTPTSTQKQNLSKSHDLNNAIEHTCLLSTVVRQHN